MFIIHIYIYTHVIVNQCHKLDYPSQSFQRSTTKITTTPSTPLGAGQALAARIAVRY